MKLKITPAGEIFWLGKHQIPFNFALRARVQGTIAIGQLQSALRQLCLRHPLIRTRLSLDAAGQAWLVSEDVPELPVRTLENCTSEDWQAQVQFELGIPFVPASGPFVRLLLLRGCDFVDLVLVFSHNCVDGMAGAFITQDLLTLLGEPERQLISLPPLEQDLFDLVPVSAKGDFGQRLQCWGIQRFMPLAAMYLKALPQARLADGRLPPRNGFELLAWELDAEQTTLLLASCRAQKTSLHCAVSTAFLRADAELEENSAQRRWLRRVSSPINLRGCLSAAVGETAGLYMSTLTTAVDCHPRHPFWRVARELKMRLNQEMAGHGKFHFVLRTHAALTGLSRRDRAGMLELLSTRRPDYDLGVTNLGRLAISEYTGTLKIEAITGPLVNGFPLERTVSLVTFGGKLHFGFIYRNFVLSPVKAAHIKMRAMQILADALNTAASSIG